MSVKRIFLSTSAIILFSTMGFADTSVEKGELFKHRLFMKYSPLIVQEETQSSPVIPEIKKGWVQWTIEKIWNAPSPSASVPVVQKEPEESRVSQAFSTLKSAVNGALDILTEESSIEEESITPASSLQIPEFTDTIGYMNSIPLLLNPAWDGNEEVHNIVSEGIQKYFKQMKTILRKGGAAWEDQSRLRALQKAGEAFHKKYFPATQTQLPFNAIRQRAKWVAGPFNIYPEVVGDLMHKTREKYLERELSAKKKFILRDRELRKSLFESPLSSPRRHSSGSLRRIWKEKGPQRRIPYGLKFIFNKD